MSNKYCQALVELRNKPAHELKEVGDQWRTPDNIFWGINTLFGPFVLDLFTDGDNTKCAAYYTAEDNALAHDWSSDKIKSGVILLESAAKTLNLSNSSKLGAYQKLSKVAGLPELMPIYAIDAPADAPDGSSRPTLSLSALLKQYGIRLTANQAYHQMAKLGIVEQRERYSRTAINNIKKFWSLTAKGCMFGKNITSPANPRETQPHFFESRFPELLKLLDTVH
ncbi:DNA N-6-adenine-methyltransferase [Escherichia coli]|uniref:DNA N-6-adenine-methyltransferase n=3 Tax=Escherichia coli TaxID=562 RepID=UPI000B42B0D9|nr:DNA N-6-adenine-methyltransferase [Escherichia coli]